jgi:hypothetical protein
VLLRIGAAAGLLADHHSSMKPDVDGTWQFVKNKNPARDKGKGKGNVAAADGTRDSGVLWGSRTPEWACPLCYHTQNWACRIKCQGCEKPAPMAIRQRAQANNDRAIKAFAAAQAASSGGSGGKGGKGKGKSTGTGQQGSGPKGTPKADTAVGEDTAQSNFAALEVVVSECTRRVAASLEFYPELADVAKAQLEQAKQDLADAATKPVSPGQVGAAERKLRAIRTSITEFQAEIVEAEANRDSWAEWAIDRKAKVVESESAAETAEKDLERIRLKFACGGGPSSTQDGQTTMLQAMLGQFAGMAKNDLKTQAIIQNMLGQASELAASYAKFDAAAEVSRMEVETSGDSSPEEDAAIALEAQRVEIAREKQADADERKGELDKQRWEEHTKKLEEELEAANANFKAKIAALGHGPENASARDLATDEFRNFCVENSRCVRRKRG